MWILELHHKSALSEGLAPGSGHGLHRGGSEGEARLGPVPQCPLHPRVPSMEPFPPQASSPLRGGPALCSTWQGRRSPSRGFRSDHPLFGAAPPTHACMLHLRDGAGSSGHGFWAQGFLQMGRTWGLRLQDQHPWTLRAYPPTSLIKEPSHSSRSGRARAPPWRKCAPHHGTHRVCLFPPP